MHYQLLFMDIAKCAFSFLIFHILFLSLLSSSSSFFIIFLFHHHYVTWVSFIELNQTLATGSTYRTVNRQLRCDLLIRTLRPVQFSSLPFYWVSLFLQLCFFVSSALWPRFRPCSFCLLASHTTALGSFDHQNFGLICAVRSRSFKIIH